MVRFRLLDRRWRVHGLSDLSVPAQEFAQLGLDAETVFICENLVNVLAFPDRANSVVVFGKGYAEEQLFDATWLGRTKLYYWGDIDTHGLALLDRFRRRFPNTKSLLMDRETLLLHRAMWVSEAKQNTAQPTALTAQEAALFRELREGTHGANVRLEQERVSFAHVRAQLSELDR